MALAYCDAIELQPPGYSPSLAAWRPPSGSIESDGSQHKLAQLRGALDPMRKLVRATGGKGRENAPAYVGGIGHYQRRLDLAASCCERSTRILFATAHQISACA